jgi:hypothetical protein
MSDYRIAVGLTKAERARTRYAVPVPSSPAAKLGLTYERKIGRELVMHVNRGNFVKLEHNPWFTFYDSFGIGNCCPDFLLWGTSGIVVIEVKLTWVAEALDKLHELYCPVVSVALGIATRPLVICRSLTSETPKPQLTLRQATTGNGNLLLWPSNGHITW